MNQNPFGLPPPVGHVDLTFTNPDPRKVIILERVVPNTEPDYCVHGRTRCMRCQQWCWLGDKTLEVVRTGKATPMCIPCAKEHLTPQTFVGRFDDRRRTEGPHT